MTIVNISNNTGVKGNAKWDQQEQQKKTRETETQKTMVYCLLVDWLNDATKSG